MSSNPAYAVQAIANLAMLKPGGRPLSRASLSSLPNCKLTQVKIPCEASGLMTRKAKAPR